MELHNVIIWPVSRLGQALKLIGEKSGLSPKPEEIPLAPEGIADNEEAISKWIEELAQWMGIEADPVEVSYGDMKTFILRAAPAIIRLPGGPSASFMALLGQKKKKALVLGKDGGVYPIETCPSR